MATNSGLLLTKFKINWSYQLEISMKIRFFKSEIKISKEDFYKFTQQIVLSFKK